MACMATKEGKAKKDRGDVSGMMSSPVRTAGEDAQGIMSREAIYFGIRAQESERQEM